MCECGGAGVRGQHASSLASIMSAAEAASLPIASELAICKKKRGFRTVWDQAAANQVNKEDCACQPNMTDCGSAVKQCLNCDESRINSPPCQ